MAFGDIPDMSRAIQAIEDARIAKERGTRDSQDALIRLGIIANANLASEFHSRLAQRIRAFEAALDPSQDVGVQLVSFGQSITFHVTNVGFHNPSLIVFRGVLENGNPVELIQHVSQLSFLLVAMKRSEPEKPRRTIGFYAPDDGA